MNLSRVSYHRLPAMRWIHLLPWALVWAAAVSGSSLLAQVRILDPLEGAYVSDRYEVVLEIAEPSVVTRTQLLLNEEPVFDKEGAHTAVVVDFGETIEQHHIVARLVLQSGETVASPAVVTKALRVDFETTARVLLLSALVKNGRGSPILGLERKDFRVFEDGNPVEIRSFFTERLPLDLVLVLDTSSSLGQEGITTVRKAAHSFVQNLADSDRVAIFEIKNEPIKVLGFTNDRKQMTASIGGLNSKGQTALFDSLGAALNDLEGRKRGRRAIVMFTDGRDSIYELARNKAYQMRVAIERAQNAETVVYTIGLGKKINRGALETIAADTGGRFLYADRALRLPKLFQEVVLDLKHQYVLGVVPKATNTGYHALKVEVRKRRARVVTRKGYTLK
ncbi:VWA domain-containing protein [Sulfidibacter corallicola]|uniref:VWA domain-containing protein n=1 Tax=Sulfidibacter corallicola TaxID=2818388 RepID=A0A8A4TEP1_SULCO|nr:VWA domain-containing protein [Sulfidibacter corallicola]QTD47692.1 VWA domain-containing protein [Sulfidibacter corallicola]